MGSPQLATDLEHHPHAFLIVSGIASVLAYVIFLYGIRVLRRVRRVALSGNSGKGSNSLRRLMSTQIWDSSISSLSQGADPIYLHDKPARESTEILAAASSRRKAAFWDRLFRRNARRGVKGAEPVWINKQADAARARDALRFQENEADERTRQLRDMQRSGWKDMREMETAWKDGSDSWGPNWESGALRWRAKAKWARD